MGGTMTPNELRGLEVAGEATDRLGLTMTLSPLRVLSLVAAARAIPWVEGPPPNAAAPVLVAMRCGDDWFYDCWRSGMDWLCAAIVDGSGECDELWHLQLEAPAV